MPDNYGWKPDCDKYIPVMTALPPDPSLGPVVNTGFCFVNLFFVYISYAKYSKS